jgi:glycosyltransferase involved in cell wall biosynthesis
MLDRGRGYREDVDYTSVGGIDVRRFRYVGDWLAWRKKIYVSPGLLFFLRKSVADYDLVHLHDLLSIHAIAASRYCRKARVPYVISPHGSVPWFRNSGTLGELVWRVWGSRILGGACEVTALTLRDAKEIEAAGVSPRRIKLVPNFIDLSEYSKRPERGDFRRKIGLDDRARLVLYLGRIHWIKGIDLLIDAFNDLSMRMDNIHLAIVGPDDGQLDELRKKVRLCGKEGQVHFVGPLYDDAKRKAYVDADVYVLPSRYEAFGNTILEACACGTPVIVTDKCGLSEYVSKFGAVVSFEKSELAETLERILTDKGLAAELSSKGLAWVHDWCDKEAIVLGLERIYEACSK